MRWLLLVAIIAMAACNGQAAAPVATPSPAPEATMVNGEPDWAHLTDAQWKARLTPEQYDVLRRHGTEAPFCGGYSTFKANGVGEYDCAGCGLKLFDSTTAFNSGTGWPSFFQPVEGAVGQKSDGSFGMDRTEVHCARCGGHLGHVFEDGPAPTGKRFCINAVSLVFVPAGKAKAAAGDATPAEHLAHATFAAGCFWGVEAVFRAIPGVVDATVGYEGGRTSNPTYQDVCSDDTGHAEVCRVSYDPAKVGFGRLLVVFFENHDPTTVDRQGPDVGSQYRSAVFCADEEQQRMTRAMIKAIDASKRLSRPVVTQVVPEQPFWRAEDYHQNYFAKHGESCHLPLGVKFGDLLAGVEAEAAAGKR